MVFFNYSTMQMAAKVVFYGPGLCGKTTNLQYIYGHTSNDSRGEMVSLETETDRTLFFDLLPIDVGQIGGFNTRIQLYTVPGQVFYNTTRKLVLKGVDGVVFVADSQRPMLQANIESFKNLAENVTEAGLSLDELPLVLQYNKRDLPDICSVEELNQALNRQDWPYFEASAIKGVGVFETLKGISKLTLLTLKKRLAKGAEAGRPGPRGPMPYPPRPSPGSVAPQAGVPANVAAAATAAATAAAAAPQPPAAAPTPPVAPRPMPPPGAVPAAVRDSGSVAAPAPQPARPAPMPPPMARPAPIPPGPMARPPAPPVAPSAPLPVAAPPVPVSPVPVLVAPTPVTAAPVAAPAPPPRPAPTALPPLAPAVKKAPTREVDVLGELERIRKQSLRPLPTPPRPASPAPLPPPTAAAAPAMAPRPLGPPPAAAPAVAGAGNGQHEISRDLAVYLRREDFSRARKFSLSLQVLDGDQRVVETVRNLDVDIQNPGALAKFLLHLNIALSSKD